MTNVFDVEKTRPDQTRPDQTRPDQTRRHNIILVLMVMFQIGMFCVLLSSRNNEEIQKERVSESKLHIFVPLYFYVPFTTFLYLFVPFSTFLCL